MFITVVLVEAATATIFLVTDMVPSAPPVLVHVYKGYKCDKFSCGTPCSDPAVRIVVGRHVCPSSFVLLASDAPRLK